MKKKMCVMLLALTMALSLGACGAGGKDYDTASDMAVEQNTSSGAPAAVEEPAYYEMKEEIAQEDTWDGEMNAPADDAGEMDTAGGGTADMTASEPAKSSEKIIYTYNYSVETKTFDEFMNTVQQRVNEFGGYMESSEVNGNAEMNIRRYAYLVIRVPAEKMHEFLEMVKSGSNVTYSSSSSENVTLSYVDMQSHIEALKAEQKSLMDMLEHAESIEDIISIQSQLTSVRYELESYESQLRVYDNRINYSTLYLDINEVDRESSVATKLSYGDEVKQGLSDTLYGMGQGLRNFSIWFIVNLPMLIFLAVIIVLIFFIVRAVVKRNAKRAAERIAKRGAGGIWSGGADGDRKKTGNESGEEKNKSEQ